LLGRRTGALWGLLGVVSLGVLVMVGGQVVVLPLMIVAAYLGVEVTTDPISPAGLAWVNLAWAVAIVFTFLVVRWVHGMAPAWLSSVVGGLRWRWFATCFGLAALALVLTIVVAAFLPDAGGTDVGAQLNEFTTRTAAFALVIVLLTPLQAAGEEYVFRGYLTQAFGGLIPWTWVAVVVPAVLFALAHGLGQSWPIFFDRFAFGLVAGTLVILTGGLEAGIAMHVLNNWLAFGLALAYGDMSSALNPTEGTWWSIPVTLTQSLAYLGLAVLVGRRMGLQTTTTPGVLEASRGRV
jgi:membrane protease YdiL (CAAX protease family)